MINKIKNKLLISLIIAFTLISAFLGYSIFAEVTTEMESEGYHEEGYMTLQDLYGKYWVLCCEHGIHLPSDNNCTLKTEQGSSNEGKILEGCNSGGDVIGETRFEVTIEGALTEEETPFKSEFYMSETYGFYEVAATEIARPKEAYILAEMVAELDGTAIFYTYNTDANGNRVEYTNMGQLNMSDSFQIGEETLYLVEKTYVAQLPDGDLVMVDAVADEDGNIDYKYKVGIYKNSFVKYEGKIEWQDSKTGAAGEYPSFYRTDSSAQEFSGSVRGGDSVGNDIRIFATSSKAVIYNTEEERFYSVSIDSNYSYIQLAWWTTIAGNRGTIPVVPNDLSLEAQAFEEYILELAGVSSVEELQYSVQDYEFELNNGMIIEGEVEAPILEYKVEFEKEEATTRWDSVDQKYRIGPFKVHYQESSAQIGHRPEVMFAGMTNFELYGNLGLIDEELWDFYWIKGGNRDENDDYEFPHDGEEFYIEMDYIEGVTEIVNMHMDFKYMNAGGKYEDLVGTYYKIKWEPQAEAIWCKDWSKCSEGSRHTSPRTHYYPSTDSEGNTTWHPFSCSGGHSCPHGYFYNHIRAYKYWVEVIGEPELQPSQRLASGLIGARWYEEVGIDVGYTSKDNQGSVAVTKELVGDVDTNLEFTFELTVTKADGTVLKEILTAKPGYTDYSSVYTWGELEAAPTYEIKEIDIPEGWELIGIENAHGALGNGQTVVATAKNQSTQKHGNIEVTKELIGDVSNKKFEFEIYINDKLFDKVTVRPGQTVKTDTIYWNANEPTPTYEVREVNLPDGFEIINIENATGTLREGATVSVIGKNKTLDGSVSITKELLANDNDTNKEFEFELYINGDLYRSGIKVKPGQTVTIDGITWDHDSEPPKYEVREVNIPSEYELVEISNATGTVGLGEPAKVTAYNKSIEVKTLEGSITVSKQMADGRNNIDTKFAFELYINGELVDTFTLRPGDVFTHKEVWKETEAAPTYEVKEVNIPDGFAVQSITNATGTFANGEPISVKAINMTTEKYGSLAIKKIIKNNVPTSDKFTFDLYIDGSLYQSGIQVGANETVTIEKIKWTGTTAPRYEVKEVNIPSGASLVKINNGTGTLSENGTVTVEAINELEQHSGRGQVTKQIEVDDKTNESDVTDSFTFKVTIRGNFMIDGRVYTSTTFEETIQAGQTFTTPEITWYGNEAPRYTVEEINIPEGWSLKEIKNGSGLLQDDSTVQVQATNSAGKVIVELTMAMGGKVWEEIAPDDKTDVAEAMQANGKYDEDRDIGVKNAEVTIWRIVVADGREIGRTEASAYGEDNKTKISFPIYTDDNGNWSAPHMAVPALSDDEKESLPDSAYAVYDVEFGYNGQKYEPTKFLVSANGDSATFRNARNGNEANGAENNPACREYYLKDSMAYEVGNERQEFNNKFAQILGKYVMQDDGSTIGQAIGTNGTSVELEYEEIDNGLARKESALVMLNSDETIKEKFLMKSRTSTGGLTYPFDDRVHLESKDTDLEGLYTEKYTYSATYPYTLHINLGLLPRKEADLAVTKDLEEAKVVVNEKLIEYDYSNIDVSSMVEADKANNGGKLTKDLLQHQIEVDSQNLTYELDLYKSDYYYRASMYNSGEMTNYLDELVGRDVRNSIISAKTANEMEVYLTYKISAWNESNEMYTVTMNEIVDYFDGDLELINSGNYNQNFKYIKNEDGTGDTIPMVDLSYYVIYDANNQERARTQASIDWSAEGSVNGSKAYNKISTTSLRDIRLAAGEHVDIYVSFKVNRTDNSIVNDSVELGEISNIAELSNYSVYNAETGEIEGKVDSDSAPENLDVTKHDNDKTWYEDDTDSAPIINLQLYSEQRSMDGLMWEDSETETLEFSQKVGDGKYTEGEKLIKGATVKLVEKLEFDGKEYNFIWPTSFEYEGRTVNLTELTDGFNPETKTNENGVYKLYSVPAGHFVVRFMYGDKEAGPIIANTFAEGEAITAPVIYNGQDYKSTAYQNLDGVDNDANDDGLYDNEYHDLTNELLGTERVSDARDNELRRLKVVAYSKTITNPIAEVLESADKASSPLHDELFENTYMYAETAKINMEVENLNKYRKQAETGDRKYFSKQVGGVLVSAVEGITSRNDMEAQKTAYQYQILNIDCGLELRSSTILTLDKQIEKLSVITSDGNTLLEAVYTHNYTVENDGTVKVEVVLDKERSTNVENLQALDTDDNHTAQGFRYINIDEDLMQGTTIKIDYKLTVLDTGEVDRTGEISNYKTAQDVVDERANAFNTANSPYQTGKGIVYGKYLGETYYSGKDSDDASVTTKVDTIIDYVDNNAALRITENTGITNQSWLTVNVNDLNPEGNDAARLLNPNVIYTDPTTGERTIIDDMGVAYITATNKNVAVSANDPTYNPSMYQELAAYNYAKEVNNGLPADQHVPYMAEIKISASAFISPESDEARLDYNNLAEILAYTNTVGRRDVMTVVGNAEPAEGEFIAAYGKDYTGCNVLGERDSAATEIITLSPPTGLSIGDSILAQIVIGLLISGAILVSGIVVIKKKVIKE